VLIEREANAAMGAALDAINEFEAADRATPAITAGVEA
jgi:glyoxylate carboligase